ncbi:hypothetical protein NITLEN_80015 [Nitrospira lenta]|uniref:Uncharacterized protein n=1 Tax=Nitrospira lenta TaxID=1436998 RepID=A0A330LA56_9BACT|nr:hypothetical protein NITLEN_80015 [Nitrospira lenta]
MNTAIRMPIRIMCASSWTEAVPDRFSTVNEPHNEPRVMFSHVDKTKDEVLKKPLFTYLPFQEVIRRSSDVESRTNRTSSATEATIRQFRIL